MHKTDVIKLLRGVIDERSGGNNAQWALANDLSPQYVGDVLLGKRDPGKSMLRALNLKKTVSYEVCGPIDG